MAVTIYDVARLAGVGVGTVSRAINNSPHIKPETRARVMKAIEELGFTPHGPAKRMARKRLGMIAAIMPFYTGHFYQELLRGIQQALADYENDLIIYCAEKPSKVVSFLDRILQEKRCDGVLTISFDFPPEYVQKFRQISLPVLVLDRAHDQFDCVLVDNEQGAYTATRHLIELGHRRIAMVTGIRQSVPSQMRYRGYMRAMREEEIVPDPALYVSADDLDDPEAIANNDGFNERTGWRAMERLTSPGAPPTAIFAASDIQALGVIKFAREHKIKIPDTLSVIGFDDIELAAYFSLTTMRQPMREMGRLAVETLMEKIEKRSEEMRHILLRTRLVDRGSTAPPRQ